MKPYSEACEQNRQPILEVLEDYLIKPTRLLEIGSGSGQHGVYFASALPNLRWQLSDLQSNLGGIELWFEEAALPNLLAPLELDVRGPWPENQYDAIFSANTVHIMSWKAISAMFSAMPSVLTRDGLVLIYGPFNYNGEYTSESNARFDDWLKQRSPDSRIRHFEDVNELAGQAKLELICDHGMPANNRLLVWRNTGP